MSKFEGRKKAACPNDKGRFELRHLVILSSFGFWHSDLCMSVYLIATLDTKGREAAFVRDRLREYGVDVQLADAGCLGEPQVAADVTRQQVFQAAGTSLEAVRSTGDRGEAVTAAAHGLAALLLQFHNQGKVSGVLSLGGSADTTIGTAAMRVLPLGIPKLMVSTLASGQVRHYVGDKDILMLNSIVDISGINRISRLVLTNAARAMAGMCRPRSPLAPREEMRSEQSQNLVSSDTPRGFHHAERDDDSDKPLVAATMFGVTTPCIEQARRLLEEAGYEVLVFHATGNGGQAMESLIADGLICGVLDITTTELADELVGGVLSAGPHRLTAAGKAGIPQVVSVGALDMVNFHAPETIPERFQHRKFHRHNASVTLMRTTPEENA
jgi:uncharacterized protein (UPF0261 family)